MTGCQNNLGSSASAGGETRAALPCARDILSRHFDPAAAAQTDPAYSALQTAIRKNAAWSVKSGPSDAFHNHNAAWAVCAYRMGAGAEEILEIVTDAKNDGRKRSPEASVEITAENWRAHLGRLNNAEQTPIGLYGLQAEQNFSAYRDFFRAELDARPEAEVLEAYLPTLASGLAGDFFHAVIELGYYFESRERTLLSQGLAWLATRRCEKGRVCGKVLTEGETSLFGLSTKKRLVFLGCRQRKS
jgi:hypothetical protein